MRRIHVSISASRRRLYGLAVAFTVSSVAFAAMTPFLVLWGRRDAGLSGALVGLLFVAQAVGELAGGLAGGVLADRLGARQILLVSTVGMALAYGSLAFVREPGAAVALILVGGLFESAFHPTVFALVAELVAPDRRTGAYGLLRAGSNLGTILGPLAGALIVVHARLSDVFGFSAAVMLVTAVLVRLSFPARGETGVLHGEADELAEAASGLGAIVRDRRLGLLVAGGALLAVTIAWWEADGLVIVRTQRPFGASTFSLMVAFAAAITVVLQLPVSRLTRGHSPRGLLGAGALIQAAGLGLLSAAGAGLAVVAAAVAMVALGQMLWSPNLNALVSVLAPPGRGATYQAAISTTADIGMAVGPVSGLALAGGLGASGLWLSALGLGFGGAVIGMASLRPRAPQAPRPVTKGSTAP